MTIANYNLKFYKEQLQKLKQTSIEEWKTKNQQTNLSHVLCSINSKYSLGGNAFRQWCAGIYMGGVYLCSMNYGIKIFIAPDPKAKAVRRCQDSCAHGIAMPTTEGGDFVKVPPELSSKVSKTLNGAIKSEIIRSLESEIAKTELQISEKLALQQTKHKLVLKAWE